jgi:hypothetical protein
LDSPESSNVSDVSKSKSSDSVKVPYTSVSVNSSEVLDTTKLFVIPISVDSVKPDPLVISNSSEILNSFESSKVVDSSVSKCSLTVQVSDSSVSVDSVEILNSSELFVVPISVDCV